MKIDDMNKIEIDNMFKDNARSLNKSKEQLRRLLTRIFHGSKDMLLSFKNSYSHDISEHEEEYKKNIEFMKHVARTSPLTWEIFETRTKKAMQEFEL